MEYIKALKPAKLTSDVVYAGRLISHKNVDLLIKSIARLNAQVRLRCLIIGDGPELAHLKQLVSELNLNDQVTFTGFLETSEEVLSHIKSSKIYVLPSTREGFGISILEAIACGRRVITINHPDNAARLLVPANAGSVISLDERKLAKAILAELGKSDKTIASDAIAGYDWSHNSTILDEVYTI